MQVGVGVIATNDTVLYANPAMENLFVFAPGEMVGSTVADRFVDLGVRQKALDELERQGQTGHHEVHLRRADGSEFWGILTASRFSYGGQQALLSTCYDISRQKLIQDALQTVGAGLSVSTRTTFFGFLALSITEALEVPIALVGALQEDGETITTLAVAADGEFTENFSYGLSGTPCENVVDRNFCSYESGVQGLFPEDELLVEMGAESYVGIPLFSFEGEALGLLAVLDRQPLRQPELIETVLRLFAGRAAAEMERSRAEDALATTEARLSDAIESIPDGFVLYDAEDRLITCNQAYRDLYKGVAELIRPGVSFEELVRAMVERGTVDIPPDRREAWIDNRIVRHQAPTDSFENKLSNDRWVLVIERRTREGGTVGIRTDITDIKNAEIALRESERKYRGIFDGAQVGLARFNLINGRTLEANDHFVRMMRYDSRDDFCQHFGGPGIYVDPERWGDLLRLGRETPVVEDFTTAFYRKDGTVAWLNLNLSFDWDENRAEVVAADVTERREALEALRLAKEEAELANRAKSDFLANMSHELRTPLNAVIGFADMLRQCLHGPLNDRQAEQVDAIIHSGRHLLKIINDILDLSKVEAGRADLNEESVDLAQTAEAAMRLINDRAVAAGLGVVNEVVPPLPRLHADLRMVRQILINLLDNAIKFNSADGLVRLTAERQGDGGLALAVSDNGIGMAAEDIPRALAAFGQVDDPATRRYPGTGLGLPIVKSLMALHDGSMEVDSTVDVGTTVTVHFPVARVLE
jgi:PAS domain S-box-containing protein